MKSFVPSLMAAALAASLGLSTPAFAGDSGNSASPPPTQKELDAARAELERARKELERAAQELARVYKGSADETPRAEAYRYYNDSKRGFLGVNIEDGPDIDGEVRGVLVTSVTPGSGADKAGLKSGDLIMGANGVSMIAKSGHDEEPMHRLKEVMSKTQAGSEVKVDFERAGKKKNVVVIAGRPPAEDMAWDDGDMDMLHGDPDVLMFRAPPLPPDAPLPPGMCPGLQLAKLDADLATYFKTTDGVLVVKASDGGSLGLKSGDVIQEIDGETVKSPVEVMEQLSESKPGAAVAMKVVRQGRTESLKGTAPEHGGAMIIRKRIEAPAPPAPPRP
jgi:C-terminal processing protease CtpA/Prc